MAAGCTGEDHSAEIVSAWERGAAQAVGRAIKRIETRAKLKMSEPKSGRIYGRGQATYRSLKGKQFAYDELQTGQLFGKERLTIRGTYRGKNLVGGMTVVRKQTAKGRTVYHVRTNANTRVHQASAPGEAPAVDTGNLKANVQSRMTGATTGEVDVYTEYGLYLEMGTRHMAPRPALGPSVAEEWPQFVADMEKVTGAGNG
jgi:hypothetical protein